MNEFNEYIYESFSAAGDIVIKSMMGGFLVYFNGSSRDMYLDRNGNPVKKNSRASHILPKEV